MKNKKFNKENLVNLLIKKASGFYYQEELCEFEKTQNKSNLFSKSTNKFQNISFFDNDVTVQTQTKNSCDTIKSSEEKPINQVHDNENLTLTKKKITTHYIPPDLHAIKILFEIFSKEEVNDDIENLTNEELINLRNKLLKEINVED